MARAGRTGRDALSDAVGALERAGDWSGACARHGELFERCLRSPDPAGMADALRGQARALRSLHRLEEAEELAELSREVALRHGLLREAARALNVVAAIHHARGELERTRRLYATALAEARDVGDDQLIGFICQNLGVLANIQGDLREARFMYLESIGATLASADETNLAMVYNNLGMVCADLNEWLESEVYFDRGIEIAERLGNSPLLAMLLANRAEPLIRTGDLARARESLERAERIALGIAAHETLANAAHLRGILAHASGDPAAAERFLHRALGLAAEHGLTLEEAETLEDLASLHLARGRVAEACGALQRARERFRACGATRDAARVAALLAEWTTPSALPRTA